MTVLTSGETLLEQVIDVGELATAPTRIPSPRGADMLHFLLWCILFVLCWPLAIVFVLLYPLIWLLMLPFRLLGIAVSGVLELVRAVIFLPARLLGSRPR